MTKELLELAKQIYALQAVMNPHWDQQQQARDSVNTATQFFLAVQGEPGPDSTAGGAAEPGGSPPANQASTEQAEMSGLPLHPQPGNTTGSVADKEVPGLTAARAAAEARKTAPGADKDYPKTPPSQSEPDPRTLHVQGEPYPPYQKP